MISRRHLLAASLILAAAAASGSGVAPSGAAQLSQRVVELEAIQATAGNNTLGDLEARGDLIKLLRLLDFFATCPGRQLNGNAVDFVQFNVEILAREFADFAKKPLQPGDMLSKVSIFEKINKDRELYNSSNPADREEAKRRIRNWTVNEFLEALPPEIRHYDKVVDVACNLTNPAIYPSVNRQGLAWRKLKTKYDQARLISSGAGPASTWNSSLHIYPDAALYDVPEAYLDDVLAAVMSHELIHGLQHQLAPFNASACDAGQSVLTRRSRKRTTRIQLDDAVQKWYDEWREENHIDHVSPGRIAAGAGVGAVVGGVGAWVLGGSKRGWAAGGAVIGGYLNRVSKKSVTALSSSEHEADYEGVALACKAGYKLEGFKLMFRKVDPTLFGSGFSEDPRDVLQKIDHNKEFAAADEAGAKPTCALYADTRLRYINVIQVAKLENCPASFYALEADPSKDSSAPDNPKAASAAKGATGAATNALGSQRIGNLIDKCRQNDKCIDFVARPQSPPKVTVKGRTPQQAAGNNGKSGPGGAQVAPAANPALGAPAGHPAAPAGSAEPAGIQPAPTPPVGASQDQATVASPRFVLSNGYCDLSKLDGKWKGRYLHSGVAVPFDLTLHRIGQILGGKSTEPDTRPGKSGMVEARWAGALSPQGMVFERQYVVDTSFVTRYFGYCNKENTIISGEWNIDGTPVKGEFELLKQP